MAYQLTPEEQAMVDEANRLSATARTSGHAPSKYLLDKWNNEAGGAYHPLGPMDRQSSRSHDFTRAIAYYRLQHASKKTRSTRLKDVGALAAALKTLLLHR